MKHDLEATAAEAAVGLEPAEAAERLARHGPNELPSPARPSLWRRALDQLRDPMALLLIAAAAVSGLALGERVDAIAILAIVALNAGIGLVEEGRATRALEALRTMETPMARVLRAGRPVTVPAREVVPGDLLLMSAGDRVSADARLVHAASLEVDESLLTGESLPVAKGPEGADDPALPPGERAGAVFSGTLVTRGSGRAVVTATGPDTELGKIAEQLSTEEPETPLQRELSGLAGRLGLIAVGVAVGVFGLTLVRSGVAEGGLEEAFLVAVALAVAAVPEGLATVVAVGLALGVRRMASRGAIVRRLPAVETLGSTTVLLTDKTGTLTENRMSLAEVLVPEAEPIPSGDVPAALAERIARVSALCSEATADPPTGDPLEVGLLRAAGLEAVERLRSTYRELVAIPFDSERRRMTVVAEGNGETLLLVKGAPEDVVARCSRALSSDGGSRVLDEAGRRSVLSAADRSAARGMRMLALADRSLRASPRRVEAEERDLTLVAVVGLADPLRAEAAAAVLAARSAGIHLLMVTGDHAGTAAAIGEQAGLIGAGEPVTDGAALRREGIPDDPLATHIYARAEPRQKLGLVERLQERGHVTAVTGDGVNDAPALHRSDIGVAMGSGSDVARESADMVVTDDNLATIVSAVEEGRGIYDNIRKVVEYLVGGNLSEVLVVVVALLLFPGLGVPLFPLQLLWINLLTDGMPALALGMDPTDPGLMSLPPRSPSERMLSGARLRVLAGRGALIAGAVLAVLAAARYGLDRSWETSRAVMFTTLMGAHLLYAFVARRPSRGLLANRWLLGAVVVGALLQAMIVQWPAAHELFDTSALSLVEWAVVVAGSSAPVAAMLAIPRLSGRRPIRTPASPT